MKDLAAYKEKADLLKALAHPTRLCIVHGLIENDCNVNGIIECLQMPQSTVSQQLAVLRNKGIIEGRRSGTVICYSVVNSEARRLVTMLMNNE
ncbi:MAG: HTH-type transcriptional repressor CzrA [Firmicutes bacterium ADurb.Bin373]|nr:winged helix-turn-helix transcriptional regulator [Bacillota bacterium]OQA06419.1 MAG: HTH-type transcriptional repressor CzrA [Firmicutes bacterium ADurb.Bin373]